MKLVRYSFLMITLLLCSIAAKAHDFEVGGIFYNITSSTGYTVAVTYKGNYYSTYSDEYSGDVVIPSTVTYNSETYSVVEIDGYTFYQCTGVTSVTIPNGVTSIGNYAFYNCSGLAAINLPGDVTKFGDYAFYGCKNLASINVPESVAYFGNYVFYGCSALIDINLPQGLSYIGSNAFNGCSSWVGGDVVIPDSVPSIGSSTFKDCVGINSIYIPSRVESIGNNAFDGCNNLRYVHIEDSEISLSTGWGHRATNYYDGVFSQCPIEEAYIGRNLSSYKSNSTTYYSTFRGNSSLKKVVLGNKVTNIEPYAFYECTNLEAVYIGNSLRSIGTHPNLWEYSFGKCTGLKYIYLFSNDLSIVGKYTFANSSPVIYVSDPETYTSVLSGCNVQPLITFDKPIKEYDGKIPEFTYVNNVAAMTMKFDTASININAGEYKTGVSVTYSDDVWSTTISVPCEYTIAKAPLTIVANNATRGYGEENPEFTCSYFGFKNGETEAVLKVKPTVSTTATKTSPQGTYPLIPYGAEATNYSFVYKDGVLTIGESQQQLLPQQIIWDQDFSNARVGDQIVLEATATSGLAVTYKVSDEDIVEIYTQNGKTLIDCLKEGTVTLRAYQTGNSQYAAADRVTKTITVQRRKTQQTTGNIDDTASEYENAKPFTTNIAYTRTFNNTNWQALYVPFEIPVTAEFLADFEVAYINNVHQRDYDDDGVTEQTEVEAFKITKGTLRANYPYLIRAKEAGKKIITVTNTTLYATEENSIDCASVFITYTFTGTYKRLESDVLPQSEGYYALSGGKWKPIAAGSSLGAFRFYLQVKSRGGDAATKALSIRMRIFDEYGNEEITEVEDIDANLPAEDVVYDLHGRRVEVPGKGVYIVNGKKMVF